MKINPDHPLRQHFAGLIEHAFCAEVGMCNPLLTDYLAEMLVEFTHIDRLNTIRNASGKQLEQIAAMLIVQSKEKPANRTERDRALYRNIGDYTLFWAGLYPEHLRKSQAPTDVLLDYVSRGKKSYAIVSELADENDRLPPRLFRNLSEDFEYCLYGLGLVRKGWDCPNAGETDGDDGLIL